MCSADSKNKCVANGSPVTHQTLQQQGGTAEESYIHLADWTLKVAAKKKKKRTKKKKKKKPPMARPSLIERSPWNV